MSPETLPTEQHRPADPDLETVPQAVVKTDLGGALPLVARGKVRDIYMVDEETLLFVATDRISAYDVVMENVSSRFLMLLEFANHSTPPSPAPKKTQNSLTPYRASTTKASS